MNRWTDALPSWDSEEARAAAAGGRHQRPSLPGGGRGGAGHRADGGRGSSDRRRAHVAAAQGTLRAGKILMPLFFFVFFVNMGV